MGGVTRPRSLHVYPAIPPFVDCTPTNDVHKRDFKAALKGKDKAAVFRRCFDRLPFHPQFPLSLSITTPSPRSFGRLQIQPYDGRQPNRPSANYPAKQGLVPHPISFARPVNKGRRSQFRLSHHLAARRPSSRRADAAKQWDRPSRGSPMPLWRRGSWPAGAPYTCDGPFGTYRIGSRRAPNSAAHPLVD